MDRLAELAAQLSSTLDQLHEEAANRNLRELVAPLSWLDQANGWLKYELARVYDPARHEAVPFTYIPIELRK